MAHILRSEHLLHLKLYLFPEIQVFNKQISNNVNDISIPHFKVNMKGVGGFTLGMVYFMSKTVNSKQQ